MARKKKDKQPIIDVIEPMIEEVEPSTVDVVEPTVEEVEPPIIEAEELKVEDIKPPIVEAEELKAEDIKPPIVDLVLKTRTTIDTDGYWRGGKKHNNEWTE